MGSVRARPDGRGGHCAGRRGSLGRPVSGDRLGRGVGGSNATGDGRQTKLRAPGDSAHGTITASQLFGATATTDRAYQGFAEVTGIVRQAGFGVYFGADVPAATGEDRYSG
jgi:large repetitive protein